MSRVWLDYAIEAIAIGFELLLLTVLLRRERWRALPIMTLLAAFTPLEDIILDITKLRGNDSTYFYSYWSFAIFDYLLQFGLIYEVARLILKPRREWIAGAKRHFIIIWSVGSTIVIATVLWIVIPSSDFRVLFYKRVSLLTSLLTCLAFGALSITANRFRLPRNQNALAIGFGLAAWNITSIIGDILGSNDVDGSRYGAWYYLRIIVWNLVVLYWAAALRKGCNQTDGVASVPSPADLSNNAAFSN